MAIADTNNVAAVCKAAIARDLTGRDVKDGQRCFVMTWGRLCGTFLMNTATFEVVRHDVGALFDAASHNKRMSMGPLVLDFMQTKDHPLWACIDGMTLIRAFVITNMLGAAPAAGRTHIATFHVEGCPHAPRIRDVVVSVDLRRAA